MTEIDWLPLAVSAVLLSIVESSLPVSWRRWLEKNGTPLGLLLGGALFVVTQ